MFGHIDARLDKVKVPPPKEQDLDSLLGCVGIADVSGEPVQVQIVGEFGSGRLAVEDVRTGEEYIIHRTAFVQALSLGERRIALLTVSQAVDRARGMVGDDDLLGQEDYQVLYDNLEEADRYPFAISLLENGVHVRSASKSAAVDILTNPHDEGDPLGKGPDVSTGSPEGLGAGMGMDGPDQPGFAPWGPVDEPLSNPGSNSEQNSPWPRQVEGSLARTAQHVCRNCDPHVEVEWPYEQEEYENCPRCGGPLTEGLEDEPSTDDLLEKDSEMGWSGSELVNERWAQEQKCSQCGGVLLPGDWTGRRGECEACAERRDGAKVAQSMSEIINSPTKRPKSSVEEAAVPFAVAPEGLEPIEPIHDSIEPIGPITLDKSAQSKKPHERMTPGELQEYLKLTQDGPGYTMCPTCGFKHDGSQCECWGCGPDCGCCFCHKTKKQEKEGDLGAPSGRDPGLNPSVHEQIGQAYSDVNQFEDTDLHMGMRMAQISVNADWFSDMSPQEQKKYKEEHPKSVKSPGGGKSKDLSEQQQRQVDRAKSWQRSEPLIQGPQTKQPKEKGQPTQETKPKKRKLDDADRSFLKEQLVEINKPVKLPSGRVFTLKQEKPGAPFTHEIGEPGQDQPDLKPLSRDESYLHDSLVSRLRGLSGDVGQAAADRFSVQMSSQLPTGPVDWENLSGHLTDSGVDPEVAQTVLQNLKTYQDAKRRGQPPQAPPQAPQSPETPPVSPEPDAPQPIPPDPAPQKPIEVTPQPVQPEPPSKSMQDVIETEETSPGHFEPKGPLPPPSQAGMKDFAQRFEDNLNEAFKDIGAFADKLEGNLKEAITAGLGTLKKIGAGIWSLVTAPGKFLNRKATQYADAIDKTVGDISRAIGAKAADSFDREMRKFSDWLRKLSTPRPVGASMSRLAQVPYDTGVPLANDEGPFDGLGDDIDIQVHADGDAGIAGDLYEPEAVGDGLDDPAGMDDIDQDVKEPGAFGVTVARMTDLVAQGVDNVVVDENMETNLGESMNGLGIQRDPQDEDLRYP